MLLLACSVQAVGNVARTYAEGGTKLPTHSGVGSL